MARRKLVQGDPNRQFNGKGTTSTGHSKEVQPTSTWETNTATTNNTNNQDATTHWQTARIAKGVTFNYDAMKALNEGVQMRSDHKHGVIDNSSPMLSMKA